MRHIVLYECFCLSTNSDPQSVPILVPERESALDVALYREIIQGGSAIAPQEHTLSKELRTALYRSANALFDICQQSLQHLNVSAMQLAAVGVICRAMFLGGSTGNHLLLQVRSLLGTATQDKRFGQEICMSFIFLRRTMRKLQNNWDFFDGSSKTYFAAIIFDLQVGLIVCRAVHPEFYSSNTILPARDQLPARFNLEYAWTCYENFAQRSGNIATAMDHLGALKVLIRLRLCNSIGLTNYSSATLDEATLKMTNFIAEHLSSKPNPWFRDEFIHEVCFCAQQTLSENNFKRKFLETIEKIYTASSSGSLQRLNTMVDNDQASLANEYTSILRSFGDIVDVEDKHINDHIDILDKALEKSSDENETWNNFCCNYFSFLLSRVKLSSTVSQSPTDLVDGNAILKYLWNRVTNFNTDLLLNSSETFSAEDDKMPIVRLFAQQSIGDKWNLSNGTMLYLIGAMFRALGDCLIHQQPPSASPSAAAAFSRTGSRLIIKSRNSHEENCVQSFMNFETICSYNALGDYATFCERPENTKGFTLEVVRVATTDVAQILYVFKQMSKRMGPLSGKIFFYSFPKTACLYNSTDALETLLQNTIVGQPNGSYSSMEILGLESSLEKLLDNERLNSTATLFRKWLLTLAWSATMESKCTINQASIQNLRRKTEKHLPQWLRLHMQEDDTLVRPLFVVATCLGTGDIFQSLNMDPPEFGQEEKPLSNDWLWVVFRLLNVIFFQKDYSRQVPPVLLETLQSRFTSLLANSIPIKQQEIDQSDNELLSKDIDHETFWMATELGIMQILGWKAHVSTLRLFPCVTEFRKKSALAMLRHDHTLLDNVVTVLSTESSMLECRASTLRWEYLLETFRFKEIERNYITRDSSCHIKNILQHPPVAWDFCGLIRDKDGNCLHLVKSNIIDGLQVSTRKVNFSNFSSLEEKLFDTINIADTQIKETSKSRKTANKVDDDREEKERWWNKRKEYDSELGKVIAAIEKEAVGTLNFDYDTSPQKLRVDQLKSCLKLGGMSTSGRKPELVQRLQSRRSTRVLFLSDSLQTIPWESMQKLREKATCRLLMFSLLSSFEQYDQNRFEINKDPYEGSYLVNPDGDSRRTETTFRDFLRNLTNTHTDKFKWEGIFGPPQPVEKLVDRMNSSDVYLYCGHGAGEKFIDKNKLHSLSGGAPAALLMGCSSARLISVAENSGRLQNTLDLKRPLLDYVSASFPAIVGNLWDVTDRDIDKFATSLLENWLETDNNLEAALQKARNHCKMEYLNGAAPICFAVPVRKRLEEPYSE